MVALTDDILTVIQRYTDEHKDKDVPNVDHKPYLDGLAAAINKERSAGETKFKSTQCLHLLQMTAKRIGLGRSARPLIDAGFTECAKSRQGGDCRVTRDARRRPKQRQLIMSAGKSENLTSPQVRQTVTVTNADQSTLSTSEAPARKDREINPSFKDNPSLTIDLAVNNLSLTKTESELVQSYRQMFVQITLPQSMGATQICRQAEEMSNMALELAKSLTQGMSLCNLSTWTASEDATCLAQTLIPSPLKQPLHSIQVLHRLVSSHVVEIPTIVASLVAAAICQWVFDDFERLAVQPSSLAFHGSFSKVCPSFCSELQTIHDTAQRLHFDNGWWNARASSMALRFFDVCSTLNLINSTQSVATGLRQDAEIIDKLKSIFQMALRLRHSLICDVSYSFEMVKLGTSFYEPQMTLDESGYASGHAVADEVPRNDIDAREGLKVVSCLFPTVFGADKMTGTQVMSRAIVCVARASQLEDI